MMRSKRLAALLPAIAMVLALWGCGREVPAESSQPETTRGTEAVQLPTETEAPVPETAEAVVQVSGAPVILDLLLRGDTVELVGRFDEGHYLVKTGLGYGMVEKELLRPEEEAPYEPRTGYARDQAAIYDNFRLVGSPVNALAADTAVELLEDLGDCLLVRFGELTGYMAPESLTNAGTENKGARSTASPEAGEDGGDITLGTGTPVPAPQEGTVGGRAVALADGTPVVLAYFDREQTVRVVTEAGFAEEKDGYRTVLLDGMYGWIAQEQIRLEGEASYESWDGFSGPAAQVYDNFWLQGEPVARLDRNDRVRVLYELDHCYLVELEGGLGYMARDQVSAEEVPWQADPAGAGQSETVPAPTQKPVEEATKPEEPEWTPPKL